MAAQTTPLSFAQQMVSSCNYTVYTRDSADKPLEKKALQGPLTRELLMKCVFVANEALEAKNTSINLRLKLTIRLDEDSHILKQPGLATALKNVVSFMNLNELTEKKTPSDAVYLYTIEKY